MMLKFSSAFNRYKTDKVIINTLLKIYLVEGPTPVIKTIYEYIIYIYIYL